MIKFNCVNCKEEMEAPQSLAGESIKCPKCGNVCTIPNPLEEVCLIPCPICKKNISPNTKCCPYCGEPISKVPIEVQTVFPKVQTIEKTGKRYKLMQLLSTFGIIIGSIGAFSPSNGIFIAILLLSLIVYICSRIGAWWNHG